MLLFKAHYLKFKKQSTELSIRQLWAEIHSLYSLIFEYVPFTFTLQLYTTSYIAETSIVLLTIVYNSYVSD